MKKDVEEYEALLADVENKASNIIRKKVEKKEQLLYEKKQLQAKLEVVETQLQEIEISQDVMLAVVINCKELKLLPPANKASVLMRRSLERTMDEVQKELENVTKSLNEVTFSYF